jgi:hypothetical protein
MNIWHVNTAMHGGGVAEILVAVLILQPGFEM